MLNIRLCFSQLKNPDICWPYIIKVASLRQKRLYLTFLLPLVAANAVLGSIVYGMIDGVAEALMAAVVLFLFQAVYFFVLTSGIVAILKLHQKENSLFIWAMPFLLFWLVFSDLLASVFIYVLAIFGSVVFAPLIAIGTAYILYQTLIELIHFTLPNLSLKKQKQLLWQLTAFIIATSVLFLVVRSVGMMMIVKNIF